MILKTLRNLNLELIIRSIYIASNKQVKNAFNLNLLEINYINLEIDFTKYDAIIFTSKNAVYSIDGLTAIWKDIDAYAISDITYQAIKSAGGNVVYCGTDGHGDKFALELIDKLQGKRVLYIRAKKVVSNLTAILKENNIVCDSIVTYETKCADHISIDNLDKNAIIIFSSPSTINCFLKHYSWRDDFIAVVIGNTTARYLKNNMKYKIAPVTTLESCVELAQTL